MKRKKNSGAGQKCCETIKIQNNVGTGLEIVNKIKKEEPKNLVRETKLNISTRKCLQCMQGTRSETRPNRVGRKEITRAKKKKGIKTKETKNKKIQKKKKK